MIFRFSGILLIFGAAMVGIFTLSDVNWAKLAKASFADGETQRAIEEEINDSLSIRELSVNLWSAFGYAVFNEGLDGVISGKDGWLFTSEEYEAGSEFEAQREDSIKEIALTVQQLEGLGIDVVVALLPDKARVMSENLITERPLSVENRYHQTLTDLADLGINAVDLLAPLLTAKDSSRVFMRADTHWSPEGARVVARSLAPYIKMTVSSELVFTTSELGDAKHRGDLINFLDTGPFASVLGLDDEVIPIFRTLQASNESNDLGISLFGDVDVPVVLVGTSYSAVEDWNFVGFLKEFASADIENRAIEGLGPFEPMKRFLGEVRSGAEPPMVVVWEIPERYLTYGR